MSSISAPAIEATIQMLGEYLSILRMGARTADSSKSFVVSYSFISSPILSFCGLLNDATGPEISSSSLLLADVPCSGGFASEYPCKDIDLLAHMPLSTFGSSEANDIWGWTSTDGREFALIGLGDGTGMVEVTNPTDPVYLGKLPTHTVNSSWRDIKVYNNHAFIVSEASNHGMQVFNLTQLLDVTGLPVTFSETAHYSNVLDAHNVVINEASGFAYIVGSNRCSGGLHMVNIADPLNPTEAGCYGGDGYVHDANCVMYNGPDPNYPNSEICFCSNTDTITVVDVSDKASPVELSRTTYTSSGYTHQGWLSEDKRYLLFGDELDEQNQGINTKTLVMDVQDLTSPFLAGAYFGPTLAIDHNLYVKDGFVYLASYRAGLRVLKINDLSSADLSEIGFFDIYPSDDRANFNGAWSVYPFFASGIAIVSGIEQGLFVLRPDLTATESPTAAPSSSPTRSPSVLVCDGNGVCNAGEDCNNCPDDCGSLTGGKPSLRYCCDGDMPDCGDSRCTCAGAPTASPVFPTTASPAFATTPSPTASPVSCKGNKASCSVDVDCCSLRCTGGACKGNRRLGSVFGEEAM
jgi:choice-of-anchor B domain-containing protein